jgi:hypothetical protein
MATVSTNPIINSLSGRLGKTLVFKRWGDKTILARYAKPKKKQSEQQKQNRSKFREAAHWAKIILKDPVRKAYYQNKARKLGLPNAYTAAITDYMRKPNVEPSSQRDGKSTYHVYKKDFPVKRGVEARIVSSGEVVQVQTFEANVLGECVVSLRDLQPGQQIKWVVTDDTGRRVELQFEWTPVIAVR